MSKHNDLHSVVLLHILQHLKSGNDEHSSLTHTRLGLAQNILMGDGTGNTSMLHYKITQTRELEENTLRRMLETAGTDSCHDCVT